MSIISCVECGKDYDDSLEVANPLPDNSCYVCGSERTLEEIELVKQNTNPSMGVEPTGTDKTTEAVGAIT